MYFIKTILYYTHIHKNSSTVVHKGCTIISNQAFDLLTKEYSLVLATNKEDFQRVKEVRSDVFEHRYSIYQELKNAKWYLFSKDDKQSFIYLLRHNATDKYIGTVRVFFINTHTPIQKMPMDKDNQINNIKHLTNHLPICEISRLTLSHERPENKNFSTLRLNTLLSMSLMIATRINLFLYNYFQVFAIMEDSLHRILRRQNVYFEQIGDTIDYYGKRTPFTIERNKLLKDTEHTMGEVTRFYLKKLCQNPDKFWEFIDNNPYLERSDMQLDRICKLFEEYGEDVDLSLLLGESVPEETE